MSFGASKPIAVRIIGTDYDVVRKHAEKIAAELKKIPYLRDIGFEQTLDYPTVEVEIDRELAGLIGVTPDAPQARTRHGDLLDPLHQPQLLDQRTRPASTTWCRSRCRPCGWKSRRISRSCRWSRSTPMFR